MSAPRSLDPSSSLLLSSLDSLGHALGSSLGRALAPRRCLPPDLSTSSSSLLLSSLVLSDVMHWRPEDVCPPISQPSSSSLLLSNPELSDKKCLCALDTSPPRNRCTFLPSALNPEPPPTPLLQPLLSLFAASTLTRSNLGF